jgi:excisionase family DNA binding protein
MNRYEYSSETTKMPRRRRLLQGVAIPAQAEPLTVTIPDACRMLGIGRTKIYELIGAGDVRAIRVAGRTLVDVASLRALIAAAPAWKGAA